MSDSNSAQRNPAADGKTVLLVDDDGGFRDAFAEVLRAEGCRVVGASSGSEALDKLRWGLRPSLVLIDLQMQIMTGWDFRTEQQKDPALAGIPVVAMTAGYWKERDRRDFTGCLAKPIDLKELRALLRQV